MFDAIKVTHAIRHAVHAVADQGSLEKYKVELMIAIALNANNSMFAKGMLKSGFVKCRYTAAAANIARIAVFQYRESEGEITTIDWSLAARAALLLAGASSSEATEMLDELLRINAQAEGIPFD